MKKIIAWSFALALAASVTQVCLAQAPTLTRSDFMTGLQRPWDMAFLSNGTMFYTEKCLGLSIRFPNGTRTRLFGVSGSARVANDLLCQGQGGMMGVAVDPKFANNRRVYVMMSSSLSSPHTNRVIRLTLDASLTTVTQRVDIVPDIPYKNAPNDWGNAGAHNGGRIGFNSWGQLFIATGDNHSGPLPQNLKLLGGKVLRVNRNGAAIAKNSPPQGADPRIFAYGFRNVQGIAFRPGTSQVFISEHGPNHSDEVTRIQPGGNGGWDPKPDPGVTCASNYCGYISNRLDGRMTSMTDLEKFRAALRPTKVYSDSQGLGPSTFLLGSQWKSWNGALMVGIMAAGRTEVLRLDSNGGVVETAAVPLPGARIRSLVMGPGNILYVALDSGTIWRVIAN
jgi:aldose sugar dehydrogenase